MQFERTRILLHKPRLKFLPRKPSTFLQKKLSKLLENYHNWEFTTLHSTQTANSAVNDLIYSFPTLRQPVIPNPIASNSA
jgi:hypothetical protein